MGKDTIADLLTSIRNADMNKKGTVRVVSTNIPKILLKYFYERVLLKVFGNIRNVTDISWFQLCDIKRERLEKEYIEQEPF